MAYVTEALAAELEEFSIVADKNMINKMKGLCDTIGLSVEDMVESWMAFSVSRNLSINPTAEHLALFEREEMAKLNKQVKSRKSQGSKKHIDYDPDIAYLDNKLVVPEQRTPESQKSKSVRNSSLFSPNSFSPVPSTPSARYASRKASGDVVCTFGCTEAISWCTELEGSCTISPFNKQSALLNKYNYMFEKLRVYASVLNDMIEDMAAAMQKAHDVTEWASIQLPAMEPVPMVGRICLDGTGKLNAQSLLLEGSQETSSGHVLPLDVSQLEKYSFFPGQIVAGLGVNNDGKKILLKELYEFPALPFPSEAPSFSDKIDSLAVVIAVGPFTTSDSLSYEPLADLMKYLKSNKPHLCIMCGPFVDINHEEIQKNSLSETYKDIFMQLVKTTASNLDGINTKVVLVPSLRDAHHIPVYPVPPYEVKQKFQNIYFASDPCLLNVDGVVFGITSTDILLHLGKEEISFPPQSSDRLGRICSHILNQRNFYPLYPPSESVNLDSLHYEAHCFLPVTPHILVVPSDLRNFIKDVKGCCVVNPERLTKCSVGGTFARLNIKSVDPSSYQGSITENIQAEIVRI